MSLTPSTLDIQMRPGRLKVGLKGDGVPDLVAGMPVQQVEIAFLPSTYCMKCSPVPGKDGGDGRKFLGKTETCPAPTFCIASPGGAFLD